jgi:formate dehydrogenase iron-sulfur subunit
VACKQWNGLKGTITRNHGSHQNPSDLSFNTYKLVRFSEVVSGGKLCWYFFADQCRHCTDPPCMATADEYVSGAITKNSKTGAVIFTSKSDKLTVEQFNAVKEACPYNIPRRDSATGLMAKCTMCSDRLDKGYPPACVKSCPTGAMNFGDRDEMLALAKKRLAEAKKKHRKAQLLDVDETRTIFLVADDPMKYHEFAVAKAGSFDMDRKMALKKMIRPIANILRPV